METHKYTKIGNGWSKTVSVDESKTPLVLACEKKADENPGMVIVGAAVNDEIKYVDVLEPQP